MNSFNLSFNLECENKFLSLVSGLVGVDDEHPEQLVSHLKIKYGW